MIFPILLLIYINCFYVVYPNEEIEKTSTISEKLFLWFFYFIFGPAIFLNEIYSFSQKTNKILDDFNNGTLNIKYRYTGKTEKEKETTNG